MTFRELIIATATAGLLLYRLSDAHGQTIASSPELDEIKVTTGVGLSLSGIKTFIGVVQEDEFGFQYDLASLNKQPEFRQRLALTPEQSQEIDSISQAIIEEIKPLIVTAVLNDDGDKAKGLFQNAQEEMRQVLSSEQQDNLEFVTNQLAIEKYGLPKWLATNRVKSKLEISEELHEALQGENDDYISKMKSQMIDLLRQANNELLDELPSDASETMDDVLADDTLDAFLESQLRPLPQSKPSKLSHLKQLAREIRRGDCQRLCELEADQGEILKLELREYRNLDDSEIEAKLSTELNAEQLSKLKARVIGNQTESWGTVYSLTEGLLAQELQLSDHDVDLFVEAVPTIEARLQQRIAEARLAALRETYPQLQAKQIDRIAQLLTNKH